MLEKICNINDQDLEKSIKQLSKYFETDVEKGENSNYLVLKKSEKNVTFEHRFATLKSKSIFNYYFDNTITDSTKSELGIFRITEIDCEALNKFLQEIEAKKVEPIYEKKLNKLKYIQKKLIEHRHSVNPEIEVRIDHVKDENGKIINPSFSMRYPHICLLYKDEALLQEYKTLDDGINSWKERMEEIHNKKSPLDPRELNLDFVILQKENLEKKRNDVSNKINSIFYNFIGGTVERSLRIDMPFYFRISSKSVEEGTLDKIIESWDEKKQDTLGEDKKRKTTEGDFGKSWTEREKKGKGFTLPGH